MFTKTNTDKHVTQTLTHFSVFNALTFRVLYIPLQLINACFKFIKLQHYFHSHFKARLDAFRQI